LGFSASMHYTLLVLKLLAADVFLTTDDRLLRKAKQHQAEISIRIANPVDWFMEVSKS
jgi:hypothetical protein